MSQKTSRLILCFLVSGIAVMAVFFLHFHRKCMHLVEVNASLSASASDVAPVQREPARLVPSLQADPGAVKESSDYLKRLEEKVDQDKTDNEALKNDVLRNDNAEKKEITLNELREYDPKMYDEFLSYLTLMYQNYEKKHALLLKFVKDLNPDFLSSEDFERFSEFLNQKLETYEAVLNMKRPPLKNGAYYGPHDEIVFPRKSETLSQKTFSKSLMELEREYCMHACGIEDASVIDDAEFMKYSIAPEYIRCFYGSIGETGQ